MGAFRDESSTPLCLHEKPFLCKDPQGFANRDPADSKFSAQFTFGGKLGSRRVFAPTNTLSNRVLDLIVEGCDALIALKHGADTIADIVFRLKCLHGICP